MERRALIGAPFLHFGAWGRKIHRSQMQKNGVVCFQIGNKKKAGLLMATTKTVTPKSAATTNTAGKNADTKAKPTTPNPLRGIPAPSIKAAEVVVPKMSVVAGALNTGDNPSATAYAAESNQPVMLKKQELVERIVKASGAKKKDVKLIMEAALGVLGDALSAGEELNLPPLGKMKVNRQREEGNTEILILKLRRGGGQGGGGGGKDGPNEDAANDGDDD